MTSPGPTGDDFAGSLACLVEPGIAGLDQALAAIAGLGAAERAAIREAASTASYAMAHRMACRVLVVELNAARVSGRLPAADSGARWDEFIALSSRRRYWDEEIGANYPTMVSRLATALANRCAAARTMALRMAPDRASLSALVRGGGGGGSDGGSGLGSNVGGNLGDLGELAEVDFAAGDSHRAGQTVAILRFQGGTVVYKPRSVRVDGVLAAVLAAVHAEPQFAGLAPQHRIRVPAVVRGDGYGWAEYVAHRYCTTDPELAAFYRGMGHWLAIMGLLGGSDLHAENVIACGPVPVVVDCETLFTPAPPPSATGLGLAVDRAVDLVNATVLRTGLLPGRGIALGWRGADASAIGALPDQQPALDLPVLVDGGTDRARIGRGPAEPFTPASHPRPEPPLADYWPCVIEGLTEGSEALAAMDRAGRLAPLLGRFADCPIRVVTRGTEVYLELSRMLWHPVSLHDPAAAVERAVGLLARMAEAVPGAPGDPAVVSAEVADLLTGDVPFFATTPARGRLTGPGGTEWLPEQDLVADALARWRRADPELDRHCVRSALAAAYLNEGWMPGLDRMPRGRAATAGLDRRRRGLAAGLLGRIRDTAIRAEDGTVTWVAPVLADTGWSVRPLTSDLYGGLPGVAIVLAAYLRQTDAGLADGVPGLRDLLEAVLRTVRRAEDPALLGDVDPARRGAVPGGYIGLGSQVWAWQSLWRLGAAPDGLDRAGALAGLLQAASAAADRPCEVLTGTAGAVVPLLSLAGATGESRWLLLAGEIADQLVAAAEQREDTAYWPSDRYPDGLGGFAHGGTGIGWALARMALAAAGPASGLSPASDPTGRPDWHDTRVRQWADTARAAFAFDDTLYDEATAGWLDKRDPGRNAAAWCHGAVGIGLAAADLAARGWPVPPDLLARAASAVDRQGFGWNHTPCHGDTGAWEACEAALDAGQAPRADPAELRARVVGSLEANGTITGLTRGVFSPGLLAGAGGVAYQLLRMGPGAGLPSLLLQEPFPER